jgi:hypothetical protein
VLTAVQWITLAVDGSRDSEIPSATTRRSDRSTGTPGPALNATMASSERLFDQMLGPFGTHSERE